MKNELDETFKQMSKGVQRQFGATDPAPSRSPIREGDRQDPCQGETFEQMRADIVRAFSRTPGKARQGTPADLTTAERDIVSRAEPEVLKLAEEKAAELAEAMPAGTPESEKDRIQRQAFFAFLAGLSKPMQSLMTSAEEIKRIVASELAKLPKPAPAAPVRSVERLQERYERHCRMAVKAHGEGVLPH